MSRITRIQEVFATRAQAESCFEGLRARAWPYVWCVEDVAGGAWRVTALVEGGAEALHPEGWSTDPAG